MFNKLFYLFIIITNKNNLTDKFFYKNKCNYIVINVINFYSKKIRVKIYSQFLIHYL